MAKKQLNALAGETPKAVIEITKKYMEDYVAIGVQNGSISAEKLAKWITAVETAEKEPENMKEHTKLFAAIRTAFVETWFPELTEKKKPNAYSAYFKAIQSKIAAEHAPTEE